MEKLTYLPRDTSYGMEQKSIPGDPPQNPCSSPLSYGSADQNELLTLTKVRMRLTYFTCLVFRDTKNSNVMLTFAVTREDFAILCNKVEVCEISIKYSFLSTKCHTVLYGSRKYLLKVYPPLKIHINVIVYMNFLLITLI